ncbi:MAG: plastocyanin/azurin family copper-binding protein [Acidimicrobiales bacterium]
MRLGRLAPVGDAKGWNVGERRRWAATAAVLVALAGCGGGSDPGDEPGAEAEPGTVVLRDIAFKPEVLRVEAGTTVTWRFEDRGIAHDVKAEDGSFVSEVMDSGTFEHTFDRPGSYDYLCTLHPTQMTGTIEVAAAR